MISKQSPAPVRKSRDLPVLVLIAFLVGALSLFSECTPPTQPVFDNPMDTLAEGYIAPTVAIVGGPTEGSVHHTRAFTFQWSGNKTAVAFSYKIDTLEWSQWSADTSVTFESLDDDYHTFLVKAQHKNGSNESNVDQRNFSVDVLQIPSLFLAQNLTRVKVGGSVRLILKIKEISSLLSMQSLIQYDKNRLEMEGVDTLNTFLSKNGGTVYSFPTHNAISGTIKTQFSIALSGSPGMPKGTSGTGALMAFRFRTKATGDALVAIIQDSTEVHDTTTVNPPGIVSIREFASARIVIR
jgi:hypothetical protein